MDSGKLFIGGISWETTEEHLREHFENYGDIVETVIMKDRHTGRSRGFGFVLFADPAAADAALLDRHTINNRVVEAKKAVPREEQQPRSSTTNGGSSPGGQGRTKKIFVGGLASTVTGEDFRRYFEQFGTISDAVVMYDHNTQQPRGFGFVTYDSEDSADKVLQKSFHELNDKLVEVKAAVPRELSTPAAAKSPVSGYPGGRFFYNQGYTSPAPYARPDAAAAAAAAAGMRGVYPFAYGYGMNAGAYAGAAGYAGFSPYGGYSSPNYTGAAAAAAAAAARTPWSGAAAGYGGGAAGTGGGAGVGYAAGLWGCQNPGGSGYGAYYGGEYGAGYGANAAGAGAAAAARDGSSYGGSSPGSFSGGASGPGAASYGAGYFGGYEGYGGGYGDVGGEVQNGGDVGFGGAAGEAGGGAYGGGGSGGKQMQRGPEIRLRPYPPAAGERS